jgi:hypothetical protein
MLVRVCELVLNQDPKHAVFAYPARITEEVSDTSDTSDTNDTNDTNGTKFLASSLLTCFSPGRRANLQTLTS